MYMYMYMCMYVCVCIQLLTNFMLNAVSSTLSTANISSSGITLIIRSPNNNNNYYY